MTVESTDSPIPAQYNVVRSDNNHYQLWVADLIATFNTRDEAISFINALNFARRTPIN
jgi:hypothetical protein